MNREKIRQKGGPPDSGGGRVIWWPSDLRLRSEDLKAEQPVIRSQNEPKRLHTYYFANIFLYQYVSSDRSR
ncbi:MAG: hypothetical protein CMP88_11500 [Gammaproteobacteria bacterium]|nr:hypothetical protein [Gammaproteobacteria bacterium]